MAIKFMGNYRKQLWISSAIFTSAFKICCKFKINNIKKGACYQTNSFFYKFLYLIFIFIKEKIIFTWIIRPNIFNTFIDITLILYFLKIFDYFERSSRTNSIID